MRDYYPRHPALQLYLVPGDHSEGVVRPRGHRDLEGGGSRRDKVWDGNNYD